MTNLPQSIPSDALLNLRNSLDQVDAQLIEAIAKRQQIVAEIGALKEANGRQLRDFRREAEVLAKVRARALELGLKPHIAENVLKQLIEASLTNQEQRRVRNCGQGQDKRALILGGNGKMGRWFANFLDAQGFEVWIADPSGAPDGFNAALDWRTQLGEFDLIVVAATLRASEAILLELITLKASLKQGALIFDLGSLKSPLRPALLQASAAGLNICSIHPMFGPDTVLLADRHVIFLDLGCAGAVAQAKAIFAATSAGLVDMALDEHDELIGYVLGLSHALNITFFSALAGSGTSAPKLMQMSSTTFDRQLAIAGGVANENPKLYFEIQHLNAAREPALQALEKALAELLACVRSGDEAAFSALMARGRSYLAQRSSGAAASR
jgi:chorismate mutase / prephenate dehydrogenase